MPTITPTLPHSDEGERVILSQVLLDGPAALAKALEAKLTEECFYNPLHRRVWKAILWQHKNNKPLELWVLAEELKKHNKLDEIGGIEALTQATQATGIGQNFNYWLEKLRQYYVLRAVHASARNMQEKVEAHSGQVEDFVAEMNGILSLHHAGEVQQTLEDAAGQADEVCQKALAGTITNADYGLEFPWSEWNTRLGLAKPGELIIIAARPGMGKSSCARQIARKWAQDGHCLLFSREMTVKEVAPLLVQVDTRISWREIQRGNAMKPEVEAFRKGLDSVIKLSKNLRVYDRDRTLSHIVARAKACAQTTPIKGIFIDYLQRYDAQQDRGETRDMALGRFTMAMKDLATDLRIPVILLAQLGRGVEKENREPRLSDLRECLSVKDTMMFTGQGVQYNADSPMSTISLNSIGEIESTDSRNAKRDDAPEMVSVTLQSGRYITCTPKHPIMTDDGWVEAGKLDGHSIACVRTIPPPRNAENYSFAKWIGWMLGNGSMVGYSSPTFICSCEDVAKAFVETSRSLWGFDPKPHKHWCKSVFQYDLTKHSVRTPEGNPVKQWLQQHNLWGLRSWDKEIPSWFCETADNESIAELLAGMWETDGCVITKPRPLLSYSTTSKKMAWQVVWALNRLGIFANFESGHMGKKAKHPCFKVSIRSIEEICRFKRVIKLIGKKGRKLDSIAEQPPGNTSGSRLSIGVGKLIDELRIKAGLSHKGLGYRVQGKRISQRDICRVHDKLFKHGVFSTKLHALCNPEIFWDKIRKVTKVAGGPVFDRVVPEHHNFVANGIVVHNSGNLEQDADRVIFLNAPEYKPDGAQQNLTDNDVRFIYVDAIQAKGRSDGTGRCGMMFDRPITRFDSYTPTTAAL